MIENALIILFLLLYRNNVFDQNQLTEVWLVIADDSFLFEACGCTMDGKLSIKERVEIVPKYEISKFVAQSPELTPCVCFIWDCAKEQFQK